MNSSTNTNRPRPAKKNDVSHRMFEMGMRVGQGWRPTFEELRLVYGRSRATTYRLLALVQKFIPAEQPQPQS